MAYNFEEQEQLDELKAWWNKYGTFILTCVTVVAVAVAVWRVWQWYENKQAGEAATTYEVVREAARTGDMSRVRVASEELFNEYSSSVFAAMGGLTAAHAHFEKKDLESAASALKWVVENASHAEYASVARLRLAGVLLDQGKHDEGIALLDAGTNEAFTGLFADRRGDLLSGLGKKDEAINAYEAALEALPQNSQLRNQVELKMQALQNS